MFIAVMTSNITEGIAIEEKVQPVPSSKKMALDLEINGISHRDETNDDATSEFNPRKTACPIESIPAVNGNSHTDDFGKREVIASTPLNIALELQPADLSPSSIPNSSLLPESNIAATDEPSLTSPEAPIDSSAFFTSNDLETGSAVGEIMTSSSELPDTLAPDSAFRNLTSRPAADEPSKPDSRDLKTMPESAQVAAAATEGTSKANPITCEQNPVSASEYSPMVEKNQGRARHSDLDPLLHSEPEQSASSRIKADNLDTEMADAPQVPVKIARGREDDEEMEPSAKRTKTEATHSPSEYPSPPNPNGEFKATHGNNAISQHQSREVIKILKNVARTTAGKNFKASVAVLWPTLADSYNAMIPNPMDLSIIEQKLRDELYSTFDDLKADFHLIYQNAVTFNGIGNIVTKWAMETRDSLLSKIGNIPPEPVPAPKKDKKPKRVTPAEDSTARTSSAPRPSRASQAAPAAQTFALDPTTNTPLIRRDSTKGDGGRPKREIHPPKNKDLPYAVRPKNKKQVTELKFCEEVLTELQKPKHNSFSHPFMIPVDPVALSIPNYFAIIKKPMDISTIAKKLKDGIYVNASDFEKDIRQIFINCYKYNPEGNLVRTMGKQFEDLFNSAWSKKDQYLVEHTSPRFQLSEEESEGESAEDEEEAEGPSVNPSLSLMNQKERLLEEQSKLISMMGSKHKDDGLLQMQQDLVELIQKRIKQAEEQAKKPVTKKAKAPKKKSMSSKKSAPAKKSASSRLGKKYLGTLEKETISHGLGALPEELTTQVVEMIKSERPDLKNEEDGTMELDIDTISETVLWQIHSLIMKHAPEIEAGLKQNMVSEQAPPRAAKPPPKKKNKPMSKHEQERKIEALTNLDADFARASSDSQEPILPTVEQESSGDEESASEEE